MIVDQKLINACKNNNRKAQFELFKLCYGTLMAVCLRYERNKEDAQALVNEGFLKIVTGLDKYHTHTPFEAWIRRIMINTIIDKHRKNKKDKEHLEYTDFADDPVLESRSVDFNEAALKFDAEELEEMVKELPNVTRKVFNMHVIDGYSHKEIAAELDISVGTGKWHVSNARKLLKKKLEKKMNKENISNKSIAN